MSRGWKQRSAVLVVLFAATAATFAQQAGGAALSDPAQVYYALQLKARLIAEDRVVINLASASTLLGSRLDSETATRVRDLVRRRDAEQVGAQRSELTLQLQAELKKLGEQIDAAMPEIIAADVPNDDGGDIFVYWKQPEAAKRVDVYRRHVTRDKGWHVVKSLEDVPAGPTSFEDKELLWPGHTFEYEVRYAVADGGEPKVLGRTPEVRAIGNLINTNRVSLFLVVIVLSAAVIYFIAVARRGGSLNIRKIAGLEAVDEAVGRATEMGRPIFFIPGIQDMNDIQTVAGLTILGRVARTAAERDATLEVPTARSLVMTAARETVHASFLDVGRPDGYDEKKIYYTTDEQFGYVAAVTGAMVREKPATCFYMGAFFAESLILAETANTTGSIQIAGTAMPAQLPFFVAACDYTLIGEEFFAASAYLSGEPQQLGSLKGQDMGKLFGLVLIVVGVLFATLSSLSGSEWFGAALDFVTHSILESADG